MSVQDAPFDRPPAGSPPPGWYPDGHGALRWWDGRAWTAATATQRPPDRTWAVLAHLSLFVLPLVGAIAIRLTRGSEDARDPFTRHHATEALNAQIVFAVLYNAALLPALVGVFADPVGFSPTVFVVCWAFGVGLMLTFSGVAIRGAVQAYRGVWWRYPIDVHLVRGTAARDR